MDKAHKDLATHRLKQAEQCLISAQALIDINDYDGAANRVYYAVFHAMRSVLALEAVDFGKHSGVIAYFRKTYIKTGVFPVSASTTISKAFDLRSDGDYDDDIEITVEQVVNLLEDVKVFVALVKNYICID